MTKSRVRRDAQVNACLPQHIKQALEQEAARERRTLSDMVYRVLEERYESTEPEDAAL